METHRLHPSKQIISAEVNVTNCLLFLNLFLDYVLLCNSVPTIHFFLCIRLVVLRTSVVSSAPLRNLRRSAIHSFPWSLAFPDISCLPFGSQLCLAWPPLRYGTHSFSSCVSILYETILLAFANRCSVLCPSLTTCSIIFLFTINLHPVDSKESTVDLVVFSAIPGFICGTLY